MAPVERKVQASTAAAALSGLLLWILGHWVFKGSVPDVVASWVYAIIPALITLTAGYFARHTPRPDTLPVITVNAAAGSAEIGREIVAAIKQYEDSRPGQQPPAPVAAAQTLTPPAVPE